jgi:hypothetical protein
MFEGLPSEIRKEFGHDPSKFLQYVQDPKNEEELAKRGILRGNDGVDISGAYSGAPHNEKARETASAGTADSDSEQTSDSASGSSSDATE